MIALRAATVAVFTAAMSGTVFAMFSTQPPSAPEPATTALFGAGALMAAGVRYLRRRRRDK